MDNIGDWLYIIFLIIAAISGMRSSDKRKKGKRKRKAMRQPAPESETMSPKEQPDEPHAAEEIPEPEVVMPSPEPIAVEKMAPVVHEEMASAPSLRETRKPEREKQESPENPIAGWLYNPDDLKKAVILSEILHRKY